jgi:hypothetical protein
VLPGSQSRAGCYQHLIGIARLQPIGFAEPRTQLISPVRVSTNLIDIPIV